MPDWGSLPRRLVPNQLPFVYESLPFAVNFHTLRVPRRYVCKIVCAVQRAEWMSVQCKSALSEFWGLCR